MKDRFTHRSRLGRGHIPRQLREEVYKRDGYCCQFCGEKLPPSQLTIDHLVPLALGGLDELTNYVTCCRPCNERKANQPLDVFAQSISLKIEELPVHGDPIIDNPEIPIQIRLLRKRLYDRYRRGSLRLRGPRAQKKLEKTYRRELWSTDVGKRLEDQFPNLPGHVRVMIPEIKTIAKTEREFLLLVELAKSANTRNLIGSIITADCDVEARVETLAARTRDTALQKRLQQALRRFSKALNAASRTK